MIKYFGHQGNQSRKCVYYRYFGQNQLTSVPRGVKNTEMFTNIKSQERRGKGRNPVPALLQASHEPRTHIRNKRWRTPSVTSQVSRSVGKSGAYSRTLALFMASLRTVVQAVTSCGDGARRYCMKTNVHSSYLLQTLE